MLRTGELNFLLFTCLASLKIGIAVYRYKDQINRNFSLFQTDGITTEIKWVAIFRLPSRETSYSCSKLHVFPLKPKDTRMRNLRELHRSYYWEYKQSDNLNLSFRTNNYEINIDMLLYTYNFM